MIKAESSSTLSFSPSLILTAHGNLHFQLYILLIIPNFTKREPLHLIFKFGLTLSINQLQPFFVFLNIDTFDNRHTQHIEDDNRKQ